VCVCVLRGGGMSMHAGFHASDLEQRECGCVSSESVRPAGFHASDLGQGVEGSWVCVSREFLRTGLQASVLG
jgi:hypothetical protein